MVTASQNAALLKRLGFDVTLVASDANNHGSAITAADASALSNARVILYRSRYLRSLGFGLGAIPVLWKEIGTARGVYLSGVFTWPVTLAGWIAVARQRPFGLSAHGGLLAAHLDEIKRSRPLKRLVYTLVVAPLVRRARVICPSSTFEADSIRREFPSATLRIVPNSTEINDIPFAQERSPREGRRFIFVGRIERDKGILRFLRIWQKVASPVDELVIVGSGRGQYAEDVAREAALDHRIAVVGEMDHSDVYRAIAAADCLVLPSGIEGTLRENFGNVVVEALAVGRPIIFSKRLSWDELERLDAGFGFDSKDKSIEEALSTASVQWLRQDAMPTRCRSIAMRFDASVVGSQLSAAVDLIVTS